MVKVDIIGIKDELTQITALLAEAGVVHLSPIGTIPGLEKALGGARNDELEKRYRNAAENMRKVQDMCGGLRDCDIAIPSDYLDFDLEKELDEIEPFLNEFTSDVEGITAKLKALEDEQRSYEELRKLAGSLKGLDVDLSSLDRFEFLHMKVGFVPHDKASLMQKALEGKSVMLTLAQHGPKELCAVVSHRDDEKAVEKVLEVALFQDLVFPRDVAGTPAEMLELIGKRLGEITGERTRLEKFAEIMRQDSCEELRVTARRIAAASLHFYAQGHFKATRDLVVLSGWIPKRSLAWFEGLVASKKDDLVILKDVAPASAINVPTKLENAGFVRPFESIVSTYGLPEYKEIDPTFYVSFGFALMFGMMFGDLGQGLVLALIGWLMRRKQKAGAGRDIANMVVLCGSVSAVFGLLFGSVFGFEHAIPALLFRPFENINLVLSIAIFWGVAFIGTGIVINIINKLLQGRYVDALLGQKGLSGILFYFGSVWFVFGVIMKHPFVKNPLSLIGMVLVPLVFVGLKDPVEHLVHSMRAKHSHHEDEEKKSGLEIIVMAVMEIYDSILGYLSNTLSFMRVAAFALNHVGLMLAVFVIGDSIDPRHDHTSVGFWLSVALGNTLVIGLEGMIVTIQTLRLIYYEGFSKFFSGEGIEYKPFSIKTQT